MMFWILTWLVGSSGALEHVEFLSCCYFKGRSETWGIDRDELRLGIWVSWESSAHLLPLLMDPDGWLFLLNAISDHYRVTTTRSKISATCLQFSVPVINHRHGELMVIVFCKQVSLLLIEEFKSLLCMAKQDILGINYNFVACTRVVDSRVNGAHAFLSIIHRDQHVLHIVCVDRWLKDKSCG